MLEAALAAEGATRDPEFGGLAERAYAWFTGANDLGLPVADPSEGACHDGLGASGLNPEALVPEPAFEIFRFDTAVAGGRLVQVMPRPDFTFALDEVLAAITPATRVVFLTNPNNPTGVSMPLDAIRAILR
jgi:hypothetical protein